MATGLKKDPLHPDIAHRRFLPPSNVRYIILNRIIPEGGGEHWPGSTEIVFEDRPFNGPFRHCRSSQKLRQPLIIRRPASVRQPALQDFSGRQCSEVQRHVPVCDILSFLSEAGAWNEPGLRGSRGIRSSFRQRCSAKGQQVTGRRLLVFFR